MIQQFNLRFLKIREPKYGWSSKCILGTQCILLSFILSIYLYIHIYFLKICISLKILNIYIYIYIYTHIHMLMDKKFLWKLKLWNALLCLQQHCIFFCGMGITSLEKNPTNSSYIFILSVNFENLTVGLNIFIIYFMLENFQEDQRSISMSSNKC